MTDSPTNRATDAQSLDLAGRQRMLTQKLQREVFGELLGQESDLSSTLELMSTGAQVLNAGGVAPLGVNGTMVELSFPPPATEAIAEGAAEQSSLIAKFRGVLKRLRTSHSKGQDKSKLIAEVNASCEALMNAAVRTELSNQLELHALESAERIRRGESILRSVETLYLCSDLEGVIDEVSPELLAFFGEHGEEFATLVPGFDPGGLLGTSADVFHADYRVVKAALSDVRNLPYETDLKLGNLHIKLSISAITNTLGEAVAFTTEWKDISSEAEVERINSIVRNTSTAFLSCDLDFKIAAVNPGLVTLFEEYGDSFGAAFQGFDPRALIGRSIDSFHRNPQQIRNLLADPSNLPYDTEVTIGNLQLGLRAYALTGANGEIVGYNTEWRDLSKRQRYADELSAVTEALSQGRLDVRCDLNLLQDDYRDMGQDVNKLVDAVAGPVSDAAEGARALARGETPKFDVDQLEGELGDLVLALDNLSAVDQSITEMVRKVADGDMTVRVEKRSDDDAMMEAFGEMLSSLSGALIEIRSASQQVNEQSSQVATASTSVSDNSTQSAASLEEINASSENIAEQTRSNAHNADSALELATEAKGQAESGDAQMKDLLEAMVEIERSSNEISKIIKVIDEIAFQTNLLALNAAVEAGRAGEHGKGFAVVAEEVGRLAGRCATAARETTDIIESSIQKVSGGMRLANDTAASLTTIVQQIGEAALLVGTIAESSQEQADGIGQINIGLSQVDQVTQRSTADAEEMAAAAAELSSQSGRMDELLSQFQLPSVGVGAGGLEMTPELMAAFQQFMIAQGMGQASPRRQASPQRRAAQHEQAPQYEQAPRQTQPARPRSNGANRALMDSDYGRY